MASRVRVPTLGESVTEATVATWFKKVGEPVAVDEMSVRARDRQGDGRGAEPAAGRARPRSWRRRARRSASTRCSPPSRRRPARRGGRRRNPRRSRQGGGRSASESAPAAERVRRDGALAGRERHRGHGVDLVQAARRRCGRRTRCCASWRPTRSRRGPRPGAGVLARDRGCGRASTVAAGPSSR
jgi:hypothetical protein